MKSLIPWLTLPTAVIAVGLMYWYGPRRESPVGQLAPAPVEHGSSERLRVAKSESIGDQRRIVVAPKPETDEVVRDEERSREKEEEAPEPPSQEERRMRADLAFESEAPDRGWALAAERQLQSELDSQSAAGHVVGVECRQTLCRVKLEFSGDLEGSDYVGGFLRSSKWPGESLIVHETDGAGRVVASLYMAREGSTVPNVATVEEESEKL